MIAAQGKEAQYHHTEHSHIRMIAAAMHLICASGAMLVLNAQVGQKVGPHRTPAYVRPVHSPSIARTLATAQLIAKH